MPTKLPSPAGIIKIRTGPAPTRAPRRHKAATCAARRVVDAGMLRAFHIGPPSPALRRRRSRASRLRVQRRTRMFRRRIPGRGGDVWARSPSNGPFVSSAGLTYPLSTSPFCPSRLPVSVDTRRRNTHELWGECRPLPNRVRASCQVPCALALRVQYTRIPSELAVPASLLTD